MVKDEQVVRLRQLLRPNTTLKEIALQANMDTKTARKYIRLSTLPRENHRIRKWRTRTDPLAGVWEEVARQLQRNPTTSATAVLRALEVADPESLSRTAPDAAAQDQGLEEEQPLGIWRDLRFADRQDVAPRPSSK